MHSLKLSFVVVLSTIGQVALALPHFRVDDRAIGTKGTPALVSTKAMASSSTRPSSRVTASSTKGSVKVSKTAGSSRMSSSSRASSHPAKSSSSRKAPSASRSASAARSSSSGSMTTSEADGTIVRETDKPSVDLVDRRDYSAEHHLVPRAGPRTPWHYQRITQEEPIQLLEGQTFESRTFDYRPVADGEGVTVYDINSGLKADHVAFKDANIQSGWVVSGYKGKNMDSTGGTNDLHGHGTQVAGVIIRVAKKATLIPVKVTDSERCKIEDLTMAVEEIVEHYKKQPKETRGPAIINLTYDPLAPSNDMSKDRLGKAIKDATDNGMYTVYAMGNKGIDNSQNLIKDTSAYPLHVLGVGATDHDDHIWSLSNYGKGVDIFAPGSDILTADRVTKTRFSWFSGTSLAAPHVTGAIAILAGKNGPVGHVSPKEMKEAVLSLAVPAVKNLDSTRSTVDRILWRGVSTTNKFLQVPHE